MRICTKCKQRLSLDNYHKSKNNKDGYYPSCKNCRKQNSQKTYLNNKEKIKSRSKAYYILNKQTIVKKQNQKLKERRKTDPKFTLIRRLRNRLYYALLKKEWKKNTYFSQYIGCTRDELIEHIQKQFKQGMSWENMGLWHIDHVIPLSSAIDEKDLYRLCHYTNLRPMWAKENLSKGNKIYALKEEYTVKALSFNDIKDLITKFHYSKKLPPSKFYFGLFRNNTLVGACSFSFPTSPHYRTILVQQNKEEIILELNRLVLKDNIKNEASILVSKSLKMLPKGSIVISYADTKQQHVGYIYQACNFKYFGLTEKRKEYDYNGLHSKTVADMKKQGLIAPKLKDRSLKHRYIFITEKNPDYSKIRYLEQKYPKIRQ